MDIFATLGEEDRERVVERARAFAEPDATLWPMAVAIALHSLDLHPLSEPDAYRVRPAERT
jgi:hypothetical protein